MSLGRSWHGERQRKCIAQLSSTMTAPQEEVQACQTRCSSMSPRKGTGGAVTAECQKRYANLVPAVFVPALQRSVVEKPSFAVNQLFAASDSGLLSLLSIIHNVQTLTNGMDSYFCL